MKEDLVAVSFFCNIPYSCFGSSAKPSFPQSCKHTLESQLQTLARTSLHPVFPTHHSVYTLSRTLPPVPLIINPVFFFTVIYSQQDHRCLSVQLWRAESRGTVLRTGNRTGNNLESPFSPPFLMLAFIFSQSSPPRPRAKIYFCQLWLENLHFT